MTWRIVMHPKARQELNALPFDMRAKITRLVDLIQAVGPFSLKAPHVKSLGHQLMELRVTGKDGISRVVYACIKDKRVFILHAFIKKTQRTPAKAIECALQRLKEENHDQLDPI